MKNVSHLFVLSTRAYFSSKFAFHHDETSASQHENPKRAAPSLPVSQSRLLWTVALTRRVDAVCTQQLPRLRGLCVEAHDEFSLAFLRRWCSQLAPFNECSSVQDSKLLRLRFPIKHFQGAVCLPAFLFA